MGHGLCDSILDYFDPDQVRVRVRVRVRARARARARVRVRVGLDPRLLRPRPG